MSTTAAQAKRAKTRATRRAAASERKRLAKIEKERRAEENAEKLAPRVQREPILSRNGEVLRGPRLEPDGILFRRSNPVRRMRKLGEKKSENPVITKAHEDAADRLLTVWEEAETITSGVGSYGERTGGQALTGVIADAVIQNVNRQITARIEIEMVLTHLGPLWNVVHAVVIRGVTVAAWGQASGMLPNVAAGYLAAALDRLVEIYRPKEDRPQRIRAAEIRGVIVEEIGVSN